MAEPRKKFDLAVVDENYAGTDPAQAHQAAGIREGVKRERARLDPTMAAAAEATARLLKQTHAQELDRLTRTIGKAAHRDGILHGIFVGIVVTVILATGTWLFFLKDIVLTNVAASRVPLPGDGVPELVDREHPVTYERINPREPPSAP